MSDMNRRDFISATIGTVGALSAAPTLLGTEDKAGTRNPVVGENGHEYEAIHDWGQLPDSIKWGNTHGVCEDSHGHIYIHHTVGKGSRNQDTIVVFDAKGKFVTSWGKQFGAGAHGLFLRKEGSEEFLYLCDMQHGIVTKRTLKGEEVFTLGHPAEADPYKWQGALDSKGIGYRPTNVAIAPNGDLYVGDGYGSSYINVYNSKGEYQKTFGGLGKDAGQLHTPHGLFVDLRSASPVLIVADRANNRLQRFTLDGQHIDFVEGVLLPCNFDERGGMLVIPDLQGRVTLMDQNNKVITHLGDAGKTIRELFALRTQTRDKFTPGKFVCPHGAIFDHEGNIFVVEWVEVGRVTKLRKV